MGRVSTLTVTILAGGLGTRLRPMVPDQPKVLAEVNGRPFLTYILDQLIASGFHDIVLCTGFLGGQVREVLGDTYQGVRLLYSQERSPLGTGGALRFALPWLRSDPVLVLNGDTYAEVNFEQMLAYHDDRNAVGTILLTQVRNSSRYGRVELDGGGDVIEFREKAPGRELAWVNAGVYILARSVIMSIPESTAVSLEQDILPLLVGKGLCGFKSGKRFIDIGTPESYKSAPAFFSHGLPLSGTS